VPSRLPPDQAWPLDEPLLNDHRAGVIPDHRASMRTGRRVPLDALPSAFHLDHVCGVRGMDDVVRVAVEDDAPRDFLDRRPPGPALPRMAANAEGRSAADR